MNILNWVKRSGWRGLGVMGLMLLGLAAPGLSAAANVDVQIATFTDSPDPATRGGQITYTTVVKNGGPAIATDVLVTWPVPATTSFVSVSDGSGGGTCIHNGATPGVVTCSYASFPVDVTSADWKTVTLVVQTGASTPATVSSSVSVSQTGNTDTNAANDTTTQNTTINAGANLSFAISGAPDPSVGAGNVTWSIIGSNLGPNTSGPITVTVPIPGTLTYVSGTGTGWSCVYSAPNAVCTRAALASGASYATLSIVTKITSQISGGTLTVGGSIGQTTVADPVSANNTATASVTVNPGLDLQITQDVPSPTSANAGGVAMTFVLRPSNLGPYDATTGANVSFPLPAGFTLTSATGTNGWTCSSAGTPITVTCSLATSMVSGANSALTIVTGTPATVTGSTSYTLTGTVAVNSGGPTDPIPGNNTDAKTVTVTPIGLDLAVAKSKTPALVAEGATLTTTINVASVAGGVQAAAGTITVTDVLDPVFETYAGFGGINWSCSATALPAASQTVTCTYNDTLNGGASASALTITTTAVSAGTATNNAAVAYSGTPGDYNPANNGPVSRSTVITAVLGDAPDLIAGLTVSTVGGTATTLETNESTVSFIATLTNNLATADDAVNTQMTLNIPARVTGGTSMAAIAVVVTNTSGLSTATYTCTPVVGILATSSIVCTQNAGILKPGDLVTFTVPVSRPLFDGTFTNPPNVTVTSLTQGDPVPGNNTAVATVIIDPIADIELVSKNITSANPALAGTEVTYVVTIRNNGPSSATGVSMTDVFDIPVGDTGFTFVSVSPSSGSCSGLTAGTTYTSVNATPLMCTFGTLANAAALTVTIKIRPNWMSGNPTRTLPNTATVTTTRVENPAGGDNNNNSKSATLTINAAQVDALINNTDVPDPLGYDPAAVAIGTASTNNDVTYDVSITNNGPSLVSGLGFTYTMTAPAGKTITFRGDGAAATVASTTPSGTIAGSICSNVGNSVTGATLTLTCTFAAPGQLASGAAAVHRYLVFRVGTAPATAGDTYTTNATVITNETDSNAANNSEAEPTSVRQRVDLTIAKTPSINPVQLRQPFNWTITLTNTGPGNSDTTILTDTLPAGMAFFGAAPSFTTTGVVKTGTCGVAGQVLTCNISTGSANPFNKDEVATITVPVRMTAYPSGGTTTNCASATTDQVDPVAGNNTVVCTNLAVQRSSIAGQVFNDPNRNGLFAYTTGATGTDTGMNVNNIMVLTGTDAYGNTVNLTRSTAGSAASAGAYLFNDLSPADAAGYTLTETQPASHINGPTDPPAPTLSGTPSVGDQGVYARGGLAGNSSYTNIKLAANQAGTNYNFPELRRPELSGRVYADVNANNSYNSGTDTNISGATVVLRNAADLTNSVATTTTAANGTYSFTLLDPLLTYVLEEPLPTTPAGLSNQATAVNVGTVNAVVTGTAAANTPSTDTDRITGIDLSSGVDGINYNFGEGGTLATTKVLTSVNGAAPGASVKAGDVLIYTITTTTANASASTSLCETTPANTSYTGAVGEGWSAGQGACAVGTTHNQVITVNVGTPVSKTYTVTVASPLPDNITSIDNTVAVTNGTCTTCSVSKPTAAKLAILKTVPAATVNAGQSGSYTLTVSNLGGSATSGLVTFTDTLPAGLSYPTQATTGTLTGMSCSAAGQVVTCSGTPNLGTGATGTLSYTVNVAVGASGTLTNDVKFTTGAIGGDPRTPSCNATTPAAGANSQSTDKLCAKASVNVTASISGVVFNDRNRNGTQDGTEPGIAGVSLKLVAGTDCSAAAFSFAGLANPVMTVVTTGAYSFSPVPYGAQYTICETQPSGYADGPVGATTSITIASLTAGGSTGNNFPEVLGSISGKVFADFGSGTAGNNNNGTQEASEPGIGSGTANLGVPVTLTGTPSVGPALPVGGITVFTDATGTYSFVDVFPGTYTVTEGVIPLSLGTFNDGLNTAGPVTAGGSAGVAGAVGVNTISNIILAAGSQGAGNNFAELPVTSISGVVYLDINENNLIDPIPTDDRIGGATLTLYAGSTCSGSVFGTTTSAPGTGAYSFLNLSAGLTYTVCETQPAGFEEGAVNPGTNAALTAATVNAITVTNLPGSGSANNNFGERVGIDLRVSKTHTPTTFTTDNVGTYTLRVRNVGLQASSGAYTVTDNLPPGMTLASVPAGTGWVCTGLAGATSMACTSSASIAAGVTSADVITVQVNVPAAVAAVPQPVYNVVYVEGGGEPDQKKPTLGEKSGPPTSLPDCDSNITQNICRDPTTIILSASLSGTVWYDVGPQTRVLEAGDRRLPGWTVEVVDATNTVIGSAVTGTNGTYLIDKLPAKVAVSVRFREPLSNVTWGYPVNGEQVPNSPAPCDEAAAVAAGTASSCVVRAPNSQLSVVLQPGANLAEQSLPVDPSGVVYDSVTRLPVPGSVVTLAPAGLCTGWDPATAIVGAGAGGYTIAGGTISMTVGADGFYQYLFVPGAGAPASCTFTLTVTPPTTHRFVSGMIPPDTGTLSPPGGAAAVYLVQPQALAPTAGVGSGTLYFLSVTAGNTVAGIIHNHIPLDPATLSKLVLTKTGDRRIAEMGDTVVYTLSVRNVAGQALPQVTLRDRLPAGFTLIKGTVKTQNDGGLWVLAADPAGNLGPVLGFNLGALGVNATTTLQYRVRVGVGAMQGTGINVAKAHGCGAAAGCLDPVTLQPLSGTVDSNEARHKVEVTGGVFTDDACLLGKVFVDCNNNHIQDAEELGIPGVRLYLENGQFMVTDSEGKYSRCGITPRSHVLTPDPSTLPRGSVLTTTSNRNLGDANSLFIDLKNGELHRGDFAEGSCTNPVLEQVKARRSQGEVRSVETEKSQAPALRFQSKPLSTPQQGTDSANQPLVQPRQGASDAR